VVFCLEVLLALFLNGSRAWAATLMGSVVSPDSSVVADLTAEGGLDWKVWNVASGTPVASPVAATATLSGSPNFISTIASISPTADKTLRGSTTTSTQLFSYSNGTTAPITAQHIDSIFSNALGTVGAGLQLTVQGDTNAERTVYVWATGFDASGTMTATVTDGTTTASTFTFLPQSYTTPEAPTLFTIQFKPDTPTQFLNLQYVMTAESSGSSHVAIQAVAVGLSTTPEPSRVMLGLVGLMMMGMRRKRQASEGATQRALGVMGKNRRSYPGKETADER